MFRYDDDDDDDDITDVGVDDVAGDDEMCFNEPRKFFLSFLIHSLSIASQYLN